MILMAGMLTLSARTHLVQPGETLYSISKKYEVSQEALAAANPTLIHGTHVPAGAVLVIPEPEPQAAQQVTPQQKEEQSVPVSVVANPSTVVDPQVAPVPVEHHDNNGAGSQDSTPLGAHLFPLYGRNAYTIAVIMPFNLNSGSSAEDNLQMRSVEFYEGLLLAVHHYQQMGHRVNVLAFDLGTNKLEDILTDESLLQANLVIGPINASDVRAVAQYCESHEIDMISPFAYCPELVATNSHLYQLNTAKGELYDRLSEELLDHFAEYEFVFVCDSLYADKQDAYPSALKRVLAAKGRGWHDFTFTTPSDVVKIDVELGLKEKNVLYIPTSSNRETMHRIIPSLKNKSFLENGGALDGMEEEDGAVFDPKDFVQTVERETALFGYPEWQKYTHEFMDSFFDLNVYMFTKFYANPFDEEAKSLESEFRQWFARDWMNLQPRYGALGYDVASYGLHALSQPSGDRGNATASLRTVQTAMSFEKAGHGCYLNKGFYLVHFTPLSEVDKIEIK